MKEQTKINVPLPIYEEKLAEIKAAARLLGAYVKIDMSLAPQYYDKPLAEGVRYFWTTITGVNSFNIGNRGFQDNNGELIGYPSWTGSDWTNIGLNTIVGAKIKHLDKGKRKSTGA